MSNSVRKSLLLRKLKIIILVPVELIRANSSSIAESELRMEYLRMSDKERSCKLFPEISK